MIAHSTSNWLVTAEGDSAIINLGADKGLQFLQEGNSSIGMFRQRWFYLHEGSSTLLRLKEWVYLRDGSMWMVRLFGRLLITGYSWRVTVAWDKAE